MPVVQFDITFPGMPCEWMSLDLMDISGEMHLDVVGLPIQPCLWMCPDVLNCQPVQYTRYCWA